MALNYESSRKGLPKSSRPANRYRDDEDYEPQVTITAYAMTADDGVGRTPDDVNYDLEGQAISVELFNMQEVQRMADARAAKEAEVADLIEKFIGFFIGINEDGMVIYWEKDFERKTDSKIYRYAALYSDGLWWITGRHTGGRTASAMITELIKMKQTPKTITVAYMAQLLRDQA